MDEKGGNKENCSGEMDKIGATLKAMPIHLNWGHIFRFPNETRQHMAVALQQLEVYADRVKGVAEMSETSVQCAPNNTTVLLQR